MTPLKNILGRYDSEGAAMIQKGYDIALNMLEGEVRGNGRPFIEHVLGVAEIVSGEVGLPAAATAAVFLHEASRRHGEIIEKLRGNFPAEVVNMAVSLNKISEIKPRDTKLEADLYRKLIVSYSNDPRVFIIKLADRLEIMRNLAIFPKSEQIRKNTETIMLYIPLAHQTGLYKIKSELEDLYLKYADPEQYRTITNLLKATEKDRQRLAVDFVEPLKEKLTAEGIKYTMKARTKSAYSIWRKMENQHISFEEVYDVFAIRFIIDSPLETEKDLCWKVYSLVTEEYEPDTNRLRDWLTRPKPNGYQSLHTTVRDRRGKYIEVQIRTERMDYEAENGFAAHWSYKGVKREEGLKGWLANVKELMQSSDHSEYGQVASSMMNAIFVYTPDGALRQLKEGASVLDFAFDIHSNLGLRCSGAKIGDKMVSIKEKLKTGDVVEILTTKNQKPTADWLNYVVTSKARSKIRQKLKEEEHKKAEEGKEILSRRLKNWKIEFNDEDLAAFVKKYKVKTANEFYALLGSGKVDVSDIKAALIARDSKEGEQQPVIADKGTYKASQEGGSDYLVIGNHLKGVDYKFAKCCNPIYGDEVFGFVTIKEGIKIHRMSCPNASRLIDSYPYRIQKVKWKDDAATSSFQTNLKILVDDDSATGNVIQTISMFKASIRSFLATERPEKHSVELTVQLYVPGNLELDKITATLKKLKEVQQVTRL